MKKWWIFPVVAAVAAGGIGLVAANYREPVSVRIRILEPQAVEQTVSCTGVVEAGRSCPVTVTAGCILSEVTAQVGEAVQAGDVLARMDKQATRSVMAHTVGSAQALALAAASAEIAAPVSGILVSVNAAAGEYLDAGEPVAVLAPTDSLQVRVAIREKDLPRLQVGQRVHVRGDGFEKAVYEGVLSQIASAGSQNAAGETVVEGTVLLEEGEADASLRLGLTARAQVVVAASDDGLLLPYTAMRQDDDGQEYVYLAENGRAVRHGIVRRAELNRGVWTQDASLVGAALILEPQKVSDGAAVVTAGGEETE